MRKENKTMDRETCTIMRTEGECACGNGLFVPVRREELINLIKARTERDLILAVAAKNGFDSYKTGDLVEALARLNGFSPRKNAEDKSDA